MMMIISDILSIINWYIRPIVKWFLRKTTCLCELQRICYGDKVGAARTINVEKSLSLSRTNEIKAIVTNLDALVQERKLVLRSNLRGYVDPAVGIIVKIKDINPKLHYPFLASLSKCLEQIWSYRQLVEEVEDLRKINFDSNDIEHENKLLKLWKLLVPHEELEARLTKQWQYIGFQGDDPKTDFRGMGLLGLENLLYFAEEYNSISSHVLSHSHHPKYGYTFAIVGINLTSMAYYLLRDGSAKTYMFNARSGLPDVNMFHKFYCYLFYEFDKLWIESKPQNIMEFSTIFKRFELLIKTELADPATVFRLGVKVESV